MTSDSKVVVPIRSFSIIHFFGPDGAGKSTHVEILIRKLLEQEPHIRKCWVRSPHTFAFLLWRLLVSIGFYRVIRNPFGCEVKLPLVNRSRPLRVFWVIVEFLSVLPWVVRINFEIFRGYKFVAERYILDTITTVAFFINDLGFLKSRISRLLLRFIPRDTIFIFLDSSFDTIFARRAPLFSTHHNPKSKNYGTVPRSAVEPQEFIDFQRRAYKMLAKSFDAITIDTSKLSIEETAEQIAEYVGYNY